MTTAIHKINQKAHDHFSDSMIIKRDGQVLFQMSSEESFDRIAAWSITKSFVSLGIGFLYDEEKIHPSQYVSEFLSGWNSELKSKVTIRHLLTHTSGIDHKMPVEDVQNLLKEDTLQIACQKEIINKPGTTFYYNNYAVNILSGIIEEITGERADLFIKRKLLDPLEITNYRWDIDKAGHALGMCGLHISADELIKLGELMLNKGVWNGVRLISDEWLDQSLAATTEISDNELNQCDGCGFLWWTNSKNPCFYTAAGILGQYCVVFPDKRVVAVRQHDFRRHLDRDNINNQVEFHSFFDDLKEFINEIEYEN